MHRRLLVLPITVAAAIAVTTLPAHAVPPERVVTETYDPADIVQDEFLTDACGFSVRSSSMGHFRVTVHFDRAGDVTRVVAHPSFRTTLISPYGSLTTSDRGMDRITENADGTITVFGTGIHLKVKGGAHAIGLWVLTFDGETGEQVSAEYHGRFDVLEPEIVDYLCDELGPRTAP